jgi:hypothetical protein
VVVIIAVVMVVTIILVEGVRRRYGPAARE